MSKHKQKPIILRLSAPEPGTEDEYQVVGYHHGGYPIYERVEVKDGSYSSGLRHEKDNADSR